MKPKIECRNISKAFIQKGTQRVHVLQDISLEVRDNEFLVILGPGQSGKSTLLRIIAGLETPSEGSVQLDGREITGPGPDRGLVFQSYMLFAWRTVMGNVEMGPKLQRVPKAERRKTAQRYIDLVGLNGFENHYPHQLSGGMKQRVGIARALAQDPKILLADEPVASLDPPTSHVVMRDLQRINRDLGITTIVNLHFLDLATAYADRIIGLRDGELVFDGPGSAADENTFRDIYGRSLTADDTMAKQAAL